jgi:flagellar biosynthesis protein FlhF
VPRTSLDEILEPGARPRTPPPAPAAATAGNHSSNAEKSLRYHQVPVQLAEQLLHYPGPLPDDAEKALSQIFRHHLRFAPVNLEEPGWRLMLIGPPGVGKTITAAKLAAQIVMQGGKVHLITTDTQRAGGVEQLAAFAKVLSVPLEVAGSKAELRDLLDSYDENDRVIIDTGGCNPYQFQELKSLGELARQPGVEPVLVCAAGSDPQEAMEYAGVFSFLDIRRTIVTRMDCARYYGSVVALAMAGDLAFSHVTHSPRAMGDMEQLTPEKLAEFFTTYQRDRLAA